MFYSTSLRRLRSRDKGGCRAGGSDTLALWLTTCSSASLHATSRRQTRSVVEVALQVRIHVRRTPDNAASVSLGEFGASSRPARFCRGARARDDLRRMARPLAVASKHAPVRNSGREPAAVKAALRMRFPAARDPPSPSGVPPRVCWRAVRRVRYTAAPSPPPRSGGARPNRRQTPRPRST